MAEPVTIAHFDSVSRAHVARALLEAHGIRAFVIFEHLSTLLPSHGLNPAGVQLQVNLRDAHRAIDLLEQDPPEGLSDWKI